MSKKRPSRKDLRALCSEPGPEDGLDPRLAPRPAEKVVNRKALQLCGQVADTLAGFFAGCGDDVLRELLVISVTPAPNSARLLVTVAPGLPDTAPEPARVLERLQHAQARLRAEVASAIHRKRVPELAFRVAT
jgi:ribosome-binding factor A